MCIHQNEIREAVWSRWEGCRGLGGSVEVGGVQMAGRQCGGGGRGAGGWETSEGGCEGCRGLVSCIPAWDGWGMSEDPTQQGACGVRRVATCYLLGAWGLVSGACAAGSSWDRNPGRCGIALGILGSWGLLRSAAQRIKEPHSALTWSWNGAASLIDPVHRMARRDSPWRAIHTILYCASQGN